MYADLFGRAVIGATQSVVLWLSLAMEGGCSGHGSCNCISYPGSEKVQCLAWMAQLQLRQLLSWGPLEKVCGGLGLEASAAGQDLLRGLLPGLSLVGCCAPPGRIMRVRGKKYRHVYVYIYIYIERERERSISVCVCIYEH